MVNMGTYSALAPTSAGLPQLGGPGLAPDAFAAPRYAGQAQLPGGGGGLSGAGLGAGGSPGYDAPFLSPRMADPGGGGGSAMERALSGTLSRTLSPSGALRESPARAGSGQLDGGGGGEGGAGGLAGRLRGGGREAAGGTGDEADASPAGSWADAPAEPMQPPVQEPAGG
jgi:hypothetical protein